MHVLHFAMMLKYSEKEHASKAEKKHIWKQSISPKNGNRLVDFVPPRKVAKDSWVRVVPRAKNYRCVPHITPPTPVKNGPPGEAQFIADWKLMPPGFVVLDIPGNTFLCSEIFIDALIKSNAKNWHAEPAPHATNNNVFGTAPYILRITSPKATLSQSTKTFSLQGPRKKMPSYGVFGSPAPPVAFFIPNDEARIYTSDWFMAETKMPFLALLVSGEVVGKMLETNGAEGELVCQSVNMIVKNDINPLLEPHVTWRAQPVLVEVTKPIKLIEEGCDVYGHVLPHEVSPTDFLAICRRFSFEPPRDLVRFYSKWDGPLLFPGRWDEESQFKGALMFYSTKEKEDGLEMIQQRLRSDEFGFHLPDSWFVFARDASGMLFWACTESGRIQGFNLEGELHGPDAPFSSWLRDQVLDFQELKRMADEHFWAKSMLLE